VTTTDNFHIFIPNQWPGWAEEEGVTRESNMFSKPVRTWHPLMITPVLQCLQTVRTRRRFYEADNMVLEWDQNSILEKSVSRINYCRLSTRTRWSRKECVDKRGHLQECSYDGMQAAPQPIKVIIITRESRFLPFILPLNYELFQPTHTNTSTYSERDSEIGHQPQPTRRMGRLEFPESERKEIFTI